MDALDWAGETKELRDVQGNLRKTFRSSDDPQEYRVDAGKLCEALVKEFSSRVNHLHSELP